MLIIHSWFVIYSWLVTAYLGAAGLRGQFRNCEPILLKFDEAWMAAAYCVIVSLLFAPVAVIVTFITTRGFRYGLENPFSRSYWKAIWSNDTLVWSNGSVRTIG